MFRVGSWLYGRSSPDSSSTQSLDSLAETQELENALRAATLIMDDDVDGAEEGLKKGNSPFHKLGKGVVAFVRATLGFEQDIMRQASERLNDAETSAYNAHRRALHSANAANAYRSAIYDPGTEYILCQSMAQLMAALVGVLNETLTESVKAFYKLRKAYIALDSIMQMEERYLHSRKPRRSTTSNRSAVRKGSSSASSPIPGGAGNDPSGLTTIQPVRSRDDSDLDNSVPAFSLNSGKDDSKNASSAEVHLTHDADSDLFNNPVDAFVHSGTNLCFGLLLLLISMVPPAFSKLLYIVGFRGDRARGLRMLWQASKFHSLTGAISSLALLAFYNGFVRCCDILPDPSDNEEDQIQGYPMERLENLLRDMRQRFPKSMLWLLEESRMESANRKLDVALGLLEHAEKSPLQQVEALLVFEKSMDSMYVHDYQLCADSFIKCVDLNTWSRALYYYIAGACHLALYRQNAEKSPSIAKEHADKATELFRKAPTQAGKKRFMAKQLPFDVLVMRKIAKWEARAKEWNVDFVDAVGVDPVEEMIFFWNGHNRMSEAHLQESLKRLEWSESSENKTWHREDLDEKAILALLRGAILRSLRRHDESKRTLQAGILCHDRSLFKGHLKDDWTCPTAHYEMASNLWMERYSYQPVRGEIIQLSGEKNGVGLPDKLSANGTNGDEGNNDEGSNSESREAHDRAKVRECRELIEKVARWEAFELDARVGLKVATAEETIKKWELAHPS